MLSTNRPGGFFGYQVRSGGPSNQHNARQDHHGRKKPRMNKVNMPSGTPVSIIIPSRSTCSCTSVGANLKLIELRPEGKMSGREYKIVADEMHKTLTNHNYKSYKIEKIQKIQNCCLWAKFRARERQIFSEVGYCNERMLFHGSSAADSIAKNGFDLSKARGGLFGRGAYFAQNSSKSDAYSAAYLGHKKMLFCRIALGKSQRLTATNGSLSSAPPGYHSVEGVLQVSEFIVYKTDQILNRIAAIHLLAALQANYRNFMTLQ